jgi:hypothetical protein
LVLISSDRVDRLLIDSKMLRAIEEGGRLGHSCQSRSLVMEDWEEGTCGGCSRMARTVASVLPRERHKPSRERPNPQHRMSDCIANEGLTAR